MPKISVPNLLKPFFFTQRPSFVLSLVHKKKHVVMKLELTGYSKLTTRSYPTTLSVLERYLPSIFSCECFNESHNSFGEEVKNTELGHLFEHIVLEFLCLEKRQQGFSSAQYTGETSWNWEIERPGTFTILMDVPLSEKRIFKTALDRALLLFSKILNPLEQQPIQTRILNILPTVRRSRNVL